MIREVADIKIKAGTETEFLAAVKQAVPLFKAAKGCRAMRIEKVIEDNDRFRLIILWEKLEDHTVGFRESEDFQKWRGLVGGYFDGPPSVDHSELGVLGFE